MIAQIQQCENRVCIQEAEEHISRKQRYTEKICFTEMNRI